MGYVPITERLLSEAGGWQALKHAKALVQAGKVVSFNYTPPLLKGLVREGNLEFRAGLKIVSPTNIENICSCPASRQWGTICAHSLALGVALLTPKPSVSRVAEPEKKPALNLGEGEPGSDGFLRLHLVLAPNFSSGWERDQVVLGAEVETNGKRVLLNTVDFSQPRTASARDMALIQKIAELGGGKPAGMLNLNRNQLSAVLHLAAGHPRITLGRQKEVQIPVEPLRPQLQTERLADGGLRLSVSGEFLKADAHVWAWHDGILRQVAPGLPSAYHAIFSGPVTIPPQAVPGFFQNEWVVLSRHFQTESQPEGTEVRVERATPEVSIALEGSLRNLSAVLQFTYGRRIVTAGIETQREDYFPGADGKFLARNRPFEEALLGRLKAAGFTGPDTTGHYLLHGEPAVLAFLGRDYPQLQREHEVTLGARFGNVIEQVEFVRPLVEINASGENWFDLSLELSSQSGQRFAASEIQRLLQMGQNHVRLKSGRVAVFDSGAIDEFNQVLRDIDPGQERPGSYRIDKVHAAYVQATVRDNPALQLKGTPAWQTWTTQQLKPGGLIQLGNLEGLLRPYQKEGVRWFEFLAKNNLGGILADDMGLGKTVQTLAFLRHHGGRSMVVAPSSLVFNWKREAERFTPELKVLVLEGSQRHQLFPKIAEADLVLTSYALLRRDIDRYRDWEFATVVLDEANHIKNPETQNAQAASALRSKNRFVLTGTPMENSVRDLWSLMNFVLPGYLGARNDFKERYEQPVAHGDDDARKRLGRRLRPVMLRRLKRDVASDLPERLEQVAFCDLSPAQAEVYRGLLDQSRRKIDEANAEKDQNRGRMLILTALLRLRQACCDLRLLGLAADPKETSAKVELLEELLQEAIDGGHRVLVFSQFVSMLQLLKENLESRGIAFCYLDGSTEDRAAVVDRFQNGEDIPVFLMSLKAGGVGLNLSAADTVIHFDPWWNPAVEAQATDRAHRIGQKRVVTAYKLITRGTVEEKILNLQQKKREAIEATIESEEPLMTSLSMQEIQELLA